MRAEIVEREVEPREVLAQAIGVVVGALVLARRRKQCAPVGMPSDDAPAPGELVANTNVRTTSDTRFMLETIAQMSRAHSDSLQSLASSQADWIKTLATAKQIPRNAAFLPSQPVLEMVSTSTESQESEPWWVQALKPSMPIIVQGVLRNLGSFFGIKQEEPEMPKRRNAAAFPHLGNLRGRLPSAEQPPAVEPTGPVNTRPLPETLQEAFSRVQAGARQATTHRTRQDRGEAVVKALHAKNDTGAGELDHARVIEVDGRASRELMREIAVVSLRGAVALLKAKLEAAAGIELPPPSPPLPLTSTETDRDVMTADEVAAFLGVDRNTVYDYAGRGVIPHQRLGKRVLFRRGALVSCKATSTRKG